MSLITIEIVVNVKGSYYFLFLLDKKKKQKKSRLAHCTWLPQGYSHFSNFCNSTIFDDPHGFLDCSRIPVRLKNPTICRPDRLVRDSSVAWVLLVYSYSWVLEVESKRFRACALIFLRIKPFFLWALCLPFVSVVVKKHTFKIFNCVWKTVQSAGRIALFQILRGAWDFGL